MRGYDRALSWRQTFFLFFILEIIKNIIYFHFYCCRCLESILTAQVIVTVPQIFEKMLVNVHDAADFNLNLGYVILVFSFSLFTLRFLTFKDEIHFIQDKESGDFWERILLLLPAKTPFVALSATIGKSIRNFDTNLFVTNLTGNAKQFTEWICAFHPDTYLIQPAHSKRHVPLVYSTFRSEFEYDIRQAKSYIHTVNPAAFPNFFPDQLSLAYVIRFDINFCDYFILFVCCFDSTSLTRIVMQKN
jgi:hypothetical protein